MNPNRPRPQGGGVQHVLDHLKRLHSENPNFYYAIQGDHEHPNANVFWADATSRINYTYFGDTVFLDTSLHSKGYNVPFAAFTGLNHHGQPVLFGCALLLSESESAYTWLFQTWLHAMSGQAPVSITTEPDRFVQMAVAQILPNTRHRYCKWSMFRETQGHLGHVYQSHPTFEAEFRKCINESETTEEFESRWGSLLSQYYLMDNEWLQSTYEARHLWVPVYMRNTFFGELQSSSDGIDEGNLYFDGFINGDTTLQVLMKQYEKAVTSWYEKELKADDNTANSMPVLKTPSPMEKQAANLYTRRIFMKFQDELVETLANFATQLEESGGVITFRVAKFGESPKAHLVSFNSVETKASCSCQKFEFCGIICRHILSVFRAKNVLTLPSEYVLRRWTRNAKSIAAMVAMEEPHESRDSLTVRYDNLRQEAIKFVEEGAKSIYVYNVAMDALREASKKVAAVKSQVSGVAHGSSLSNGERQLHSGGDNPVASGQTAEEKAMKIRELTAELNNTNKRCEVYRAKLLAVLKDVEDQKLKLSVKVQNAKLILKE